MNNQRTLLFNIDFIFIYIKLTPSFISVFCVACGEEAINSPFFIRQCAVIKKTRVISREKGDCVDFLHLSVFLLLWRNLKGICIF
jgi:hypothetical protein